MTVYVARILYPVEVLGFGKRVGIWFCGCPHKCDGCSNVELWQLNERYHTTIDTVMQLINGIACDNHIDGFTITGGEPFFQADALKLLLEKLSVISEDILVYTGYDITDLHDLENIAVLIDGKYIESRNTNVPLRGSDNQQIHVLNPQFVGRYNEYLKVANKVQNFTSSDGIISAGIHHPDFSEQFSIRKD